MTCNISLKSQENADSESSELNNKLTKSFKVVHITYAFKANEKRSLPKYIIYTTLSGKIIAQTRTFIVRNGFTLFCTQ